MNLIFVCFELAGSETGVPEGEIDVCLVLESHPSINYLELQKLSLLIHKSDMLLFGRAQKTII